MSLVESEDDNDPNKDHK